MVRQIASPITKEHVAKQARIPPSTQKGTNANPQAPVPLWQLQRKIGNHALGRLLQAKLTINEPGDEYGKEADQVVRMPTESSGFQLVQQVLQSPGQPLDSATRAYFEPRFGKDFSRVQVHTDAKAGETARAVNALAYTVGQDIVFGAGYYSPQTVEGKTLIAHELGHVIQQSRWGLSKQQGATMQRAVKTTRPYQVKDDFDPAQQVRKRQRAFGRADPILNTISLVPRLSRARFERALNKPTLAERNLNTIPRPDLSDPLLDPVRANLVEIKYGHWQRRRVQLIQEALVAWGRGLDVPMQMLPKFGADGIFGDETLAAVKEFQFKSPPLTVDGIVGDETLGRLDSAMKDLHGSVFTIDTVPYNGFQGTIHRPPPPASWTSLVTTRDFVIDEMLQDPLHRAQLANHFAKCPPGNAVRLIFTDQGNSPARILVHERHHEADQLKTIGKHMLPWDRAIESLRQSQRPFRAPDPQTATERIFASSNLRTPCELSTDIVHEWIVDNAKFHSTLLGARDRLTLTGLGCTTLTFRLQPPTSAETVRPPARPACTGPARSLVVARQIPA